MGIDGRKLIKDVALMFKHIPFSKCNFFHKGAIADLGLWFWCLAAFSGIAPFVEDVPFGTNAPCVDLDSIMHHFCSKCGFLENTLFGDISMLRLRKQNHTGQSTDWAFSCKMHNFEKCFLNPKHDSFQISCQYDL